MPGISIGSGSNEIAINISSHENVMSVAPEEQQSNIKVSPNIQEGNISLSVCGDIRTIIQQHINEHNLDNHAHKRLWYLHEQAEAASVWSIEHNLDRFPSVAIVDSSENLVVGNVTYIDSNNIVVSFNGAFKGKAYLN